MNVWDKIDLAVERVLFMHALGAGEERGFVVWTKRFPDGWPAEMMSYCNAAKGEIRCPSETLCSP